MHDFSAQPAAFPLLFSPFDLGRLRLPNRVVMAPMSSKLSTIDGAVTPELIAYYEERAAGGVGLVVVEYACVDTQTGHAYASQLSLGDPAKLEGHRRLVAAIRDAGACAAVQIHHAGGQADPACLRDGVPIAPSNRDYVFFGQTRHARAASGDEVERLIDKFRVAARYAVDAGYQALELHGAHGYLLAQFLSPSTNRRDDEWGGDFARRLAFPQAVIRAVKAELGPERPLIYRFSACEFTDGGLTIEDAELVAPELASAGADALSISSGTLENVRYAVDPMSMPEEWRLSMIRRIRACVSVPVMGTGPFRRPELAEQAIDRGDADLIVMGRPLLADPHWARKAREGFSEDIRLCTSCNWCVGRKRVGCAENPRAGRELDPPVPRYGDGRTGVVVGAGPGGMVAALMLDAAGFRVRLIERADRLGGGLIASAAPPYKERLLWYLDYLVRQIERSGVELVMGTTADAALLIGIDPVAVVLATGARIRTLGIPGENLPHVEQAYDVLTAADPDRWRGGRAIVYGGGETGCESAEFLAEAGARVALVTRSPSSALARAAEPLYRHELLERLRANPAIEIFDETEITSILDKTVELRTRAEAPYVMATDGMMLAQGRIAGSELHAILDAAGIACRTIGDAYEIRRIGDAVNDAYAAVMSFARDLA